MFLFCLIFQVEELKTKFQSVAPAIRRNETEPEEVIIARFKEEILKDERTNSDTDWCNFFGLIITDLWQYSSQAMGITSLAQTLEESKLWYTLMALD